MALNLVQHRGGPSVWEETGAQWDAERWIAAFAAGALVISGVRQRGWAGLVMTVSGGALAWWAAAGADERSAWRGRFCAAIASRHPQDSVTEASEESFPASDAPSWTPTTGNTGPSRGSRIH